MNFNKLYKEEFYLFLEEFNEKLVKNINKFSNLAIIYNHKVINDYVNFISLRNFCKKNNINLYILDNFEVFIKFKLSGIVLSHFNKNYPFKITNYKKNNIKIIGKAHTQMDYYFKKKQNCTSIFLSPVFNNNKYNTTQILGVTKFNIISANWKLKILALGGINLSNINKIRLTQSIGIGFTSFIYSPQIKKPVLFNKGRV